MEPGIIQTEIWHRDYNLDKKDNLGTLPEGSAVFGIFGIIQEQPANCRYTGSTQNLQKTVRGLFENPPGNGFKKFMQGNWVQMLVYTPMQDGTPEALQQAEETWKNKYKPATDDDGEYPGYHQQALTRTT